MTRHQRVYVTGADGMLGSALIAALGTAEPTARWPVRGVSVADFDIADAAALDASIDEFRPDIVVHAAALTIVDECEADPAAARRVNVAGTHNVAAAARRHGCRLVYLSSDYVFDGRRGAHGGYREDDVPNPLSLYGLTKLAGERLVSTVDRHLIVRTSWLFGGRDERTDNVLSLVRRALRGQPTELVADQFSSPTFTADLAAAIRHLLVDAAGLAGTVHVANAGSASWYQVGAVVAAMLRERGIDPGGLARPIRLDECGFLGQRPRDSTLNTERLAHLGYAMPGWADAVRRFCARLFETSEAAGLLVQPAAVSAP